MIYPSLQAIIQRFDAAQISEARRAEIRQHCLSIVESELYPSSLNFNFICTHNSRRSQFAQVWACVASVYYQVESICYSGGTEVTQFNPTAVQTLKDFGFDIQQKKNQVNPKYRIGFSDDSNPVECYSKRYNDDVNPSTSYIAIMTCSDADSNCPIVDGARLRLSLPYEDPKIADGRSDEKEVYQKCALQIAIEIFYLFSLLSNHGK